MKEKIIFKCIVGSQAYGTNVEGSDIDIKGVYIQSPMDILTFNYKPQIEVNKDEVYYEVRRFIELLGSANPTVLEMLYSPEDCIQVCEPEFQILLNYKKEFLTNKCKYSFGGYAIQQVKKAKGLNKKMNWEKEAITRKTPLDFCYTTYEGGSKPLSKMLETLDMKQEYCGLVAVDHMRDMYALYYDFNGANKIDSPLGLKGIVLEDSNSIRLSSVPKGHLPQLYVHYNKDGYTQHCNAYKEYQTWLGERNTQRYVDLEAHGQQIDGKNMLHCRRLIETALEIPQIGKINVRRHNAEYLKSIRHGKVNLQELLDDADEDIKSLDYIYDPIRSTLPDTITNERLQEILTEIREYKS